MPTSNIYNLTDTWNSGGTTYFGIKLDVTNTASAGASRLIELQINGTTSCFSVSASGTTVAAGTISSTFGDIVATASTGRFAINNDVFLCRDATNTLALRNGAAAQTFNNYGTYTDASNYRRVALSMTTAGVATLKPEGAGTGASGNVLHISGLPTSNPGPGILWNNAGTPAIGT
jgi:hypothetical protein